MIRTHRTGKLFLIALIYATFAACSGALQDTNSSKTIDKSTMKKPYVVASPYRGQLLRNGKPVANQKVINELRWTSRDDNPMLREIMTDEEGFFEVEEYTVELDLGIFQEFSGASRLYVEGEKSSGFEGMPGYFMSISRRDSELGKEFGEAPINMKCELTNELENFDLTRGLGRSKCTWDNMYESPLFS